MSIAHFRLLLNNRDATGEYVRQGIKWSAVEKLVAEWDALEARVAAQPPEPEPYDLAAHMRPRQHHEMVHSTCEMLKARHGELMR